MPPTATQKCRPGVSFELERLEVEEDQLVVWGHWSGVRGMRFVRPTLVIGDRQVHATLEHKPWAPTTGERWIAAFPWKPGHDVDTSRLSLAVAPSVTVALGPPDEAALHDEPEPEPEPKPAPAPEAAPLLDATLGAQLDELSRARSAAERDRDRALEQRDEAIRDRAAALRTRARMEGGHDEAVKARESAEAELEKALAERDEVRAQRDEVLVAYRGLKRHLHSERADEDREQHPEPATPAEGADAGSEEPLGVREVPAARTMLAALQRPEPRRKFVVSTFDLWAIRVLGSVAAACFILLLVLILRVFV